MSEHLNDAARGGAEAEDQAVPEEVLITLRSVGAGVVGGLVGVLLMTPLLVVLPRAIGVFRPEPIVGFASFGAFVGLEPSLELGLALFVANGALSLPLIFLTAGMFLPPHEPKYLRGVTFATLVWPGFLLAFWPGGELVIQATFLVVSLLGHWVYGAALGLVVTRLAALPEHRV